MEAEEAEEAKEVEEAQEAETRSKVRGRLFWLLTSNFWLLACRSQQLFFAVDQAGDVVAGQLEAVAVGDGVGGAGLHAVAAENAAVVVNVIDGGVAFSGADAPLGGVVGGFDVDAVRRAGRRAEEAPHAFLQP